MGKKRVFTVAWGATIPSLRPNEEVGLIFSAPATSAPVAIGIRQDAPLTYFTIQSNCRAIVAAVSADELQRAGRIRITRFRRGNLTGQVDFLPENAGLRRMLRTGFTSFVDLPNTPFLHFERGDVASVEWVGPSQAPGRATVQLTFKLQ